jgi:hypothetical protein
MGHASVTTTERYSHLRADLFRQTDYEVMPADLSTPKGNVVSLRDVTGPKGTQWPPRSKTTQKKK